MTLRHGLQHGIYTGEQMEETFDRYCEAELRATKARDKFDGAMRAYKKLYDLAGKMQATSRDAVDHWAQAEAVCRYLRGEVERLGKDNALLVCECMQLERQLGLVKSVDWNNNPCIVAADEVTDERNENYSRA